MARTYKASPIRLATFVVAGSSPLSMGAPFKTPKNDKEGPDAYDTRVWRERIHRDKEGFVIVPSAMFKGSLETCAKFLSRKIPGQRNATYTKHFEAGVMMMESFRLLIGGKPIKADNAQAERLFVPASGVHGDGKRVWKTFPIFQDWTCTGCLGVLDGTITNETFEEHLVEAGRFIGIGRFRPKQLGYYGRFNVTDIKWSEVS